GSKAGTWTPWPRCCAATWPAGRGGRRSWSRCWRRRACRGWRGWGPGGGAARGGVPPRGPWAGGGAAGGGLGGGGGGPAGGGGGGRGGGGGLGAGPAVGPWGRAARRPVRA